MNDQSKHPYGTVTFQGNTFILTEEPMASDYEHPLKDSYYAYAADSDEDEYEVKWETTKAWNDSSRLATIMALADTMADEKELDEMEALMAAKVDPKYCEDEENACNWYRPVRVSPL